MVLMATTVPAEKTDTWTRHGRKVFDVLREAGIRFLNEDSLSVAASIAYYSVLSLFPLLLLMLSLSGIYIQHYKLVGQLAKVLEPILPMRPDFILRNLEGISQAYGRVGVASFLLLLWSSAGVFMPIEKALNRAWGVETDRSWARRRLVALEMALIFALLILVSSAFVGLNLSLHGRHVWLPKWLLYESRPVRALAYRLAISLVSFLMTLAGFVVLFERLPNRKMSPRQVLPGALLTAVLWQAARGVFMFLLTRFNYRHVYGSIGAMVSFMTWAYISSAVMLYGAQVSYTLYRTLEAARRPSG